MRRWTDLQIGYAAGLLDGEGCFALHQGVPRIICGSTDLDIIERLHSMLGMGYVLGPYEKGEDRKQVWYWHLTDKQGMAELLLDIYPLMCERRQQKIVELAEYLINYFTPKYCEHCDTVITDYARMNKRFCTKKCMNNSYRARRKENGGDSSGPLGNSTPERVW